MALHYSHVAMMKSNWSNSWYRIPALYSAYGIAIVSCIYFNVLAVKYSNRVCTGTVPAARWRMNRASNPDIR
ncbi:hypothetical protein P152DRAFT_458303 [Eremomyces bilateralis CBS 781.70]|uniref:Uncharacterized protein n=1 Tax=Eremomyces bilateralis CBS 781.70 TaxID=1392243 RepID=A0A6G1G341_9PEZI|nr:uncharacterized protein P152DRAFT_458303 [Eremomyces bilateralis CBS 781.70]KAF1812463.1 hypothetical protein P152DRAFT_458303 [Eremomyces bilateralis CBS 781.70]